MQHLTYIDDFLTLVKYKSFSAASKASNITQPAFSRRIKLLEESLGTTLFNRNSHPITLTSSGEIFLQHANTLKENAGLAYKDVQEHISALDDPIKLSTSHTLAISFLPHFLKRLEPNGTIPLKLNIKHTDLCLEELRKSQTDFALLHFNTKAPLYAQDE
ncbi:MAG: LysR family transcriptional regulator, partial [Bdellovibrionales bacterium]